MMDVFVGFAFILLVAGPAIVVTVRRSRSQNRESTAEMENQYTRSADPE